MKLCDFVCHFHSMKICCVAGAVYLCNVDSDKDPSEDFKTKKSFR